MPRFKSNNLDQTRPKIKLKLQNLQTLRALPPDPQWLLASGGSALIPKSIILPLQISSFAPGRWSVLGMQMRYIKIFRQS